MNNKSLRWNGAGLIGALAVFATAAAPQGALAADTIAFHLPNGISGTVFSSEYLVGRVAPGPFGATRGTLELDDGTYVEVITSTDDPAVVNKGDGTFYVFDTGLVLDLLGAIEHPRMRLDVEVYILPFPRSHQLASSASGRRVYLSPQVTPLDREQAAHTIAHEIGHVFQATYLPENDDYGWRVYRSLRGIEDPTRFGEDAPHAYRPKEIFAEDFRVLFGGSDAYFDGFVENPELPSPEQVAGLEGFMTDLVADPFAADRSIAMQTVPNPFNPRTELRVQLPDEVRGNRLTVRIYDVTGALVRELYAEQPSGGEVRVTWDGRDSTGHAVASAAYFGVAEAGGVRTSQKIVMLK